MTDHIGKWFKVAGLMAGMRPHIAWVTSTEWGEIAAEVRELDAFSDTPVTNVPTNKNFGVLKLNGQLTLRNAGTEDQETVNEMNRIELGDDAAAFAWRRDFLITGKNPLPVLDTHTA